ncbi:MAG TPA: filamentous hemagglutinin N-terminal domain-containing protein [Nostocaceae cyanobacterium]|nr:filamentous hemagglutinin N-terminal domain-containing protein [Nostocaceae cyanobacterium]
MIKIWKQFSYGLLANGLVAVTGNCAMAERPLSAMAKRPPSVMAKRPPSVIAQIVPDNTLPINSQVTIENQNQTQIINITGGSRSANSLFHSFQEFSIPNGSIADFKSTADVENIITRVTGNSPSNINGILKTQGTANLFLINPNGVVFAPNASLQVGGSFLATTARSITFSDGTEFSATNPQAPPLLSVNVPVGLQFGNRPEDITVQSRNLRVNEGKTLALVGSGISLEGGIIAAPTGRIELGSVGGNSLVSLQPVDEGWSLDYENVQRFQDIQLTPRTTDNGEVFSVVNVSGVGGGVVQIQGKKVEIRGQGTRINSATLGSKNGEEININAEKLIVRDGARINTNTVGTGTSGDLNIKTSESIELIRTNDDVTGLFALTAGSGRAGNINITTQQLRLKDGATITASSAISLQSRIIAEGAGGNVTVNASKLVEIAGIAKDGSSSVISASTVNVGNAGTVNINTDRLILRDTGVISVIVDNIGNLNNQGNKDTPGAINVNARFIQMQNQGRILSTSPAGGNGGNINLQVQNLLLMRDNSQISASAGQSGAGGNGGNITINAPDGFIVANRLGNNDITANAYFGTGGNININSRGIYQFVLRTGSDLERLLGTSEASELNPPRLPSNDITAFSQQNPTLNGFIQINTPYADPSKGLVELSGEVVDVSGQIAASCGDGSRVARSTFITAGRGGLVPSPTEALINDTAIANWILLDGESQVQATGFKNIAEMEQKNNIQTDNVNYPNQIVEAQSWMIDTNGKVTLVAQAPTVTPHSPIFTSASCAVR